MIDQLKAANIDGNIALRDRVGVRLAGRGELRAARDGDGRDVTDGSRRVVGRFSHELLALASRASWRDARARMPKVYGR